MIRHFVAEYDTDGNFNLNCFVTAVAAAAHIRERTAKVFTDFLEDWTKEDLDIEVGPRYGRVSIEAPGECYDRIWEYKCLDIA